MPFERIRKQFSRKCWRIPSGICAYWLAFYVVLSGSAALFGALFDAWGLTTDNLTYAPVWARRIVQIHADLCYAFAYAATVIVGLLFAVRRRRSGKASGSLVNGVVVGAVIPLILTIIALLLDSVRLEWPLAQPRVTLSLSTAAITLILGKLSAEILTKRLLFDAFDKRWLAYAVSCAAGLLLTAVWRSPAGIVSALMTSLIACRLYERGGLGASVGFQTMLGFVSGVIFAWPPQAGASAYALYHVSDAWFTGGNAGIACGWGYACAMLAVAVIMFRKDLSEGLVKVKRREKP